MTSYSRKAKEFSNNSQTRYFIQMDIEDELMQKEESVLNKDRDEKEEKGAIIKNLQINVQIASNHDTNLKTDEALNLENGKSKTESTNKKTNPSHIFNIEKGKKVRPFEMRTQYIKFSLEIYKNLLFS